MAPNVKESSSSWQAKMWPLLPSPTQTLLLQACLGTDQLVDKAWRKWCKQVRNPRKMILSDRWGIKSILPLLHHSSRKSQVVLDKNIQTLLRTAFFREHLRHATIRRLCRQVVQDLRSRSIEVVLAGDLAIAKIAYDSPALRHCDGIRLLLAEDQIAQAVELIRQRNWQLIASAEQSKETYVLLADESGLELQISSRLRWTPHASGTFGEVLAGSRHGLLDNVEMCLPCWADLLLSTVGYAFAYGSSRRIEWVCDAAMLLKHPGGPDWLAFVQTVRRNSLSWPTLTVLKYLKNSFGCCVPRAVFDDLSRLSSEEQKACNQVAEFSAHSVVHRSLTEAFYRAPDLRQRTWVLMEVIRRSLRIIRKTLRDI